MNTPAKYYAIVRFGTPDQWAPRAKSFYRSKDAAAKDARPMMGSGSCTCIRVYECDTAALAKSADISIVRSGERIVWQS